MKTAKLLIVCVALTSAIVLACCRWLAVPPAGAAPKDARPALPSPAVIDAAKYPTLQAAFDAVPPSGGLVRLPPGTFELTSPLVLSRGDTRVEGAGAATHLVNRSADGRPALVVRSAPPGEKSRGKLWRVQLADFRISGSVKSGDGLLAEGINEIYIDGLSVDHNGGHGINLVGCYEDPRVCDSIVTYNGKAGLNLKGCHDIVVCGNQFEENQDALRCIDGYNLCMTGNCLDDHLRHGVVIENTYGSVVSGNMIEECRGVAIVLDRDCYGDTISANVIAHDFSGGVALRDAWGCAVSANTFTMCRPHGVYVGPASGRITITGNNFSNAHIGGKERRQDAAHGVWLEGTSDVVVSGNIFTGLQAEAVHADAKCARIAITGNAAADLNRSGKGERPALDFGAAKDVVEGHNVVQKAEADAPSK